MDADGDELLRLRNSVSDGMLVSRVSQVQVFDDVKTRPARCVAGQMASRHIGTLFNASEAPATTSCSCPLNAARAPTPVTWIGFCYARNQ